ncbi:MAG: hypothetical protein KAQ75_16640 [Bacteroidales bacterium]|nr:hypothetical protein [Bacteroidales bacterium]
MKTTLKLFLIGMMLVFFAGCKKSTTTSNENLAEFYNKAKEVLDKPAKPSDVSTLLELSGATLMPELMNNPTDWENYTINELKASANLGVYLADAMYLYAYDSLKLAYKSAIAGKALAEYIGIEEDVFMDFIGDRYRNVGGQSDSLFFVLDSALNRAENYLTSNERFKILSAIFIGNYIEKQYIISNIIFDYPVELPEESKLLLLREMMIVMSNSLNRLDFILELMERAYADMNEMELNKELKELRNMHKEYMISKDKLLVLKASDVFENEGMIKMYQQIIKIRQLVTDF